MSLDAVRPHPMRGHLLQQLYLAFVVDRASEPGALQTSFAPLLEPGAVNEHTSLWISLLEANGIPRQKNVDAFFNLKSVQEIVLAVLGID